MFGSADRYLLGRAPAASCCGYCCCQKTIPLRRGVLWTCYILILEALWHISISFARPLWEWNSSAVTILSFVLQDIARVIVLVAAARVIWGVQKYTVPSSSECANVYLVKIRIQFLFRTLLSLIGLEVLEMTVKFFEVESICDAPAVTERRQMRHPNMTAAGLVEAQNRCMLISDLYDYGLELITVALLVYLVKVVHSYGRSVNGPVIQQDAPAYNQETSSSSTDKTAAVVVGEVVATSAV